MRKLISVTLFSGLLTLLRMSSGFVIAKAVAIYTGPAGVAMLGQVGSFVTAINGIVTAPVGNGLVRYTSEHHTNGFDACAPWWRASLRWMAGLLVLTMVVAVLMAEPLSLWLFQDVRYSWLLVVAALVLPLSSLNTLCGSVINGQQQYKRYILLGAISVVLASALALVFIYYFRLPGALLAACVFTALSGCIMLAGSFRQPWFRWRYWFGPTGSAEMAGIRSYLVMAMTSAICSAGSLLLTRNILIAHVGLVQTGYWQTVYKISEVYLGVLTMALATYYFPRLAAAATPSDAFAEIFTTAKVILPFAALCGLIIYFSRDLAITILFTDEFRPARDLFAVQLVGDVFKIVSWLFAYAMIARKETAWFLGTELFFSTSLPLLVWLLVDDFGVHGANIAYLINYAMYFIFLTAFSRQYVK